MALQKLLDLVAQEKKPAATFIFKLPLGPAGAQGSLAAQARVEMDSTTEETYTLATQITDTEVQDGSVLSDNIHLQPQRISLTCVMSEAPILFVPIFAREGFGFTTDQIWRRLSGTTAGDIYGDYIQPLVGRVQRFFPGGATQFVSERLLRYGGYRGDLRERKPETQVDYWKQFLKARRLQKELFSIQTGLETINNVFFENIEFRRTQEIGNSLIFQCALKEVRVVQSDGIIGTEQAPELHKTVNAGAGSKTIAPEETAPQAPEGGRAASLREQAERGLNYLASDNALAYRQITGALSNIFR